MDTSGFREDDGEGGKGKTTFCPQKVGTIMTTMMMKVF